MEELKGAKNKQEAIWAAIQIIKRYYNVNEKSIAILLLDRDLKLLKFIHPPELLDAGTIPISASNSIASKVFMAGEGFISNDFYNVKHLAFFEKLSRKEGPIKKLIASPIKRGRNVLGVIEVSRGDNDPDFTPDDLFYLEQIGEILAEKLQELENERET